MKSVMEPQGTAGRRCTQAGSPHRHNRCCAGSGHRDRHSLRGLRRGRHVLGIAGKRVSDGARRHPGQGQLFVVTR